MRDLLDRCAAGELSPHIALARMLLAGETPDPAGLAAAAAARPDAPRLAELAALAERHRDRLASLGALARTDLMPRGPDQIAATAALFDRLAREAPEAGVAFYALGDAGELAAATAELVATIRAWAPVTGRRVLDVGCGIGRVAVALAGDAADVLGIDVSAGMIAEAQRRAAGLAGVRFAASDGHTLPVADGGADLVVAVDSLPYVVRAGTTEGFLAEAARVLPAEGDLLVFNWSYRGDDAADRAEAERLAARYGFALLRAGERPFAIWDGAGYHLRRCA